MRKINHIDVPTCVLERHLCISVCIERIQAEIGFAAVDIFRRRGNFQIHILKMDHLELAALADHLRGAGTFDEEILFV